jgi:hypothetical protein
VRSIFASCTDQRHADWPSVIGLGAVEKPARGVEIEVPVDSLTVLRWAGAVEDRAAVLASRPYRRDDLEADLARDIDNHVRCLEGSKRPDDQASLINPPWMSKELKIVSSRKRQVL